MRKKETTQQRGAVLPPIPRDTPEGIRALAIAETVRALNEPTEMQPHGMEWQPGDINAYAERLKVPALFLGSVQYEGAAGGQRPEDIEAYVAWRLRLAGKAVQPFESEAKTRAAKGGAQ